METRGQPAASPRTSLPPRRCRPDLVHRHRFSSRTQRRAAFSIDLGPERIGERRVTYPPGSLGISSTRFRVWLLDAQSGDGSGGSAQHTSELQSLIRNSYSFFSLKKTNTTEHH